VERCLPTSRWRAPRPASACRALYTVETDEQAQQQIAALPPEALPAYAEVRTLLEVDPWAGDPYHRQNPDAPLRTIAFSGAGMVTYLILDDQRRVDVLRVFWAG